MTGRQEFRGLKGLKKQRRMQIVALAAVALVAATGLIGYAMQDGINFFRTPTEVLAEQLSPGETFRLGGLVEVGSLVRGEGPDVAFVITDTNRSIEVRYRGVLPDLFEEGTETIALGRMEDGVFVATEVLAKHDESYKPKEVVDALRERGVYNEPES
jgi:cytochrome c-type biogenesis protein CcmE